MNQNRPIRVALLGAGSVGSQVARILLENADELEGLGHRRKTGQRRTRGGRGGVAVVMAIAGDGRQAVADQHGRETECCQGEGGLHGMGFLKGVR